jgi:hypothetical protein
MLGTDFDIYCMHKTVKISLRLPSLAQLVVGPYGGYEGVVVSLLMECTGLSDNMTDKELEEYIRIRTGTIHRMVGTVSMSSWDAQGGVVNPDLSVKGTHGLRITHASVFVSLTSVCCFVWPDTCGDSRSSLRHIQWPRRTSSPNVVRVSSRMPEMRSAAHPNAAHDTYSSKERTYFVLNS